MKLAFKLSLSIFLAVCAVLVAQFALISGRESQIVGADMRRDQGIVARALQVGFETIRQTGDEARALDFIRAVDRASDSLSVRLLPIAPAVPGEPPLVDAPTPEEKARLVAGELLSVQKEGSILTYIPTSTSRGQLGAIEVKESEREIIASREKVKTWILETTVAVGFLCGLASLLLGYWLVGRPTQALVTRAKRVGEGDLHSRLSIRQHDEFGRLALELNAMCDRLEDARARVAEETAARIATIEQLRQADRLATVGKLASGIAHELGTPLNVVWARARLIGAANQADAETCDSARIIAEQCERMTKIIRQLLDFARPRKPTKLPADLRGLLEHTVLLLEPLARKRSVHFAFDGKERLEAQVDPHLIEQVFSNLLVNAIQASQPGGGKVSLHLDEGTFTPPAPPLGPGGPPGTFARVSIQDFGSGITPENQVHLFEPFFTTKEVGEGTGLGLSVSLGIVREHEGWIAVRSEVGKETIFSVYLPTT